MPARIKPIKGMPGYHAGSDGSVWSAWRTRGRVGRRGVESYIGSTLKQMKLKQGPDGYCRIALRRDGKYVGFLVHRLVLETFVGPCPEGMEALHWDGDKANNRVGNLRWGTREENVQDSIRHGSFYNATKAAAAVNTGRERSPEVRAKIAAANRGKKKSPEHIAALIANHWSKNPAMRKRVSAAVSRARTLAGRN